MVICYNLSEVMFMNKDFILDKSKSFAIRIIGLYKYLCKEKMEFVMSKQILRSGTSIGANVHEAKYSVSKKEFIVKRQIALKEAAETKYWLEILLETDYISEEQFSSLAGDCEEMMKLLASSVKTAKRRE